tara:strand:+ start:426 stop:596 length:171 start_codon:yes stop_codon:yes gene_type:complete
MQQTNTAEPASMDDYENEIWLLERREEAYQDYLDKDPEARCADNPRPLNFEEWSDS